MVYRGKPSAGCENCRKAKKRCTLELPACVRCVKLKKECLGYRDTTQLQIQDETQSVLQKVGRKNSGQIPISFITDTLSAGPIKAINGHGTRVSSAWQVHDFNTLSQQASPPLTAREPTSRKRKSDEKCSDGPISPPSTLSLTPAPTSESISSSSPRDDSEGNQLDALPESRDLASTPYGGSVQSLNFRLSNVFSLIQWASGIPKSPVPLPDDVAIDFFLKCCTAEGQWSYFHQSEFRTGRDSCLDFAIKACGMAALTNVRLLPGGREWSRSMYTKAIGLLNGALQDPTRSKTDDSLVAVTMLSFYENLVCDSMQSIKSWKAHIDGATQLLRLRGKSQLDSMSGRQLFRELRGQILVACIWDDRKPPEFLKNWREDLQLKSTTLQFIGPVDALSDISWEFAEIKYKVMRRVLTASEALESVQKLDADLLQWSISTPAHDERWRYTDIKVKDSPHVWKQTVSSYSCVPIPGTWNMYRSIRILLSRTAEVLARSFAQSPDEQRHQIEYARSVRKQMTDEICSTIPCCLGHASPAFNSPCVLVTAYHTIWPLFFAGTSALERLGLDMYEKAGADNNSSPSGVDAAAFADAATQAAWLLGRLDYISAKLGLKWADGIAGSLREAIQVHKNKLFEATSNPDASVEYLAIVAEIVKGVMAWRNMTSLPER